ncbi:MAG: MarR family transcriptional regulator [Anaerolineae bacterium]|nr:MarR family transcriptional regulator [Anaerolineae bacterium]
MTETTILLQRLIEIHMRHSMRRIFRHLKEHGLSKSQMSTLLLLHNKGACGVSDISEYLGITAPASSQLLNRLVEDNLIERLEDPVDRRVKRIVLTDHGHGIIQESFCVHQTMLTHLTDKLSKSEQALVNKALTLLLENISHEDALEFNEHV